MNDRIAKQKLNVILMVDCSTSMRGERIEQVNNALKDIQLYLTNLQNDNINVDFNISVITFSTNAFLLNKDKEKNIAYFKFNKIKAGGWSNLHLAYDKLDELLEKEKKGGIMPDFGGTAPIIILLTDGHPTGNLYKESLDKLKKKSWFNIALKYGIAIELKDNKTMQVLRDFVGKNGDVIQVYNSNLLQRIIKLVVLKASQVHSRASQIKTSNKNKVTMVKQAVQHAIQEVDDWEW